MATVAAATPQVRPRGSLSERFVRFWNKYLLFIYTGAAIVYLMAPVAVMILFSFNDPAGKSNFVWQGFTLDAWLDEWVYGTTDHREYVERFGAAHWDGLRPEQALSGEVDYGRYA